MSTIYTINNKIATINGKWMTKYVPPKLRIDLIFSSGSGYVLIDRIQGFLGGEFHDQYTPSKVTGWSGTGDVVDLTNSTWEQSYSAPGAYISFEFDPSPEPLSSDRMFLNAGWSQWDYCTIKVYYRDELINTINDVYLNDTPQGYGLFYLRG